MRKVGLADSGGSRAIGHLFLPSGAFRCSYIKMCPGRDSHSNVMLPFLTWQDRCYDRLLTSPICLSCCGRRYSAFSKYRYPLFAGKVLCCALKSTVPLTALSGHLELCPLCATCGYVDRAKESCGSASYATVEMQHLCLLCKGLCAFSLRISCSCG